MSGSAGVFDTRDPPADAQPDIAAAAESTSAAARLNMFVIRVPTSQLRFPTTDNRQPTTDIRQPTTDFRRPSIPDLEIDADREPQTHLVDPMLKPQPHVARKERAACHVRFESCLTERADDDALL